MKFWEKAEKDALVWLATGRSCSEIAKLLTDLFDRPFTKNMVKGQMDRMKIKSTREPTVRQHIEEPKPQVLPSFESVKKAVSACTILELTNERCKFPLWAHDRPSLDSLYCGEKIKISDAPYCKMHRKRAYNRDPRESIVTVKVPVKPAKSGTW